MATRISFSGSSVSETLIVLPMPSERIIPKPTEDLIVPLRSVHDSVIPTWSGYLHLSAINLCASTAIGTLLDLILTTRLS